jgi:hypothetical protein
MAVMAVLSQQAAYLLRALLALAALVAAAAAVLIHDTIMEAKIVVRVAVQTFTVRAPLALAVRLVALAVGTVGPVVLIQAQQRQRRMVLKPLLGKDSQHGAARRRAYTVLLGLCGHEMGPTRFLVQT